MRRVTKKTAAVEYAHFALNRIRPLAERPSGFLPWIPVFLVIVTFATLIVLPPLVHQKTDRLRDDIANVAQPASADLAQLNRHLANEMSALRGYFLGGGNDFFERYNEARQGEARLRRDLAGHVAKLGPQSKAEFETFQMRIEQWRQLQGRFERDAVSRELYVSRLAENQTRYERALEASDRLGNAINNVASTRRESIQEIQRVQTILTAILVTLGLASTLSVIWLSLRATSFTAQLHRRANEEIAFRQVASALTGALDVDEIMRGVSESAAVVTRADGSYVEKIVSDTGAVEVVATAGKGTPPRGTLVDYPGSLTEEIIERGEPSILMDMRNFGKSMAPYMSEHCPNCEIMVVPLLAENEPLGALVLLNSSESGRRFNEEDLAKGKGLADLASLALRRVGMMEGERDARQAAEAAVAARDEVLGVVSHDLRNPLTTILLTAKLLPELPPEEQPSHLENILLSAKRMDRLIRDLLDAARIDSGRFAVDLKPIDPAEIVREVCKTHEAIAAAKQQTMVCAVSSTVPEICADRDRMLQLLSNLVGNAMKFTPENGTIAVGAEPAGSVVRFSVSDTGPGIPPKELPNVFDRFWQAKKTAHLGAGLGLSIARGIAEAHGGRISVENRAEGGAVFLVEIPAIPPKSGSPKAGAEKRESIGSRT